MGCSDGGFAEPDDLFVLGGEPGQGLAAEVGEFVDRLFRLGQPVFELGDLRLESDDLGFAGVGDLSGLVQGLEAAFELDAEVRVGRLP